MERFIFQLITDLPYDQKFVCISESVVYNTFNVEIGKYCYYMSFMLISFSTVCARLLNYSRGTFFAKNSFYMGGPERRMETKKKWKHKKTTLQ